MSLSADAIERCELVVEEGAARWNLPGVSVAIVQGPDVAWAEGFGLADRDARTPMTPDTYLRVASISKLFTATAVFVLRDEGTLSIEEPVVTFLPAFPSKHITVRHLLCHASGLQREAPGDMGSRSRRFTSDEEVPTLLDRVRMPFAPMRTWKYSNLGYTILGRIVERVAGQPFARFVGERILAPLRMKAAAYDPRSVPADRRSMCYLRVPDTDWLQPDDRIWEPMWTAAGGLCSTARDLGRFAAFLAGEGGPAAPLGAASLEEMCAPQIVLDEAWTQAHALGPMLIRSGDRVLAGHAAGVFSVAGWLLVSRRDRVGAVCLTNVGDEGPVLPIACDLVEIAASQAVPATLAPSPGPVPAQYAALLGRYVGDRGLVLTVAWTRDRLTVEWPAVPGLVPPPRARVTKDAEGMLRFDDGPYAGEEMIVERETDGRVRGWESCTYWYARL